MKYQG